MSDTSASIRKSGELGDIVDSNDNKFVIRYEGANLFNSFKEEDKQAVIWIYNQKKMRGELEDSDKSSGEKVEEVARLYHAQKCAFQDILTRQGFEISSEVPKDYDGRIAALTTYGTLIILGKNKREGRYIFMDRIHSPEYDANGQRGNPTRDLKLGERVRIIKTSGGEYKSSGARALAVNPRGADGDEFEASVSVLRAIGTRTMELLSMPSEKVEIGEIEE